MRKIFLLLSLISVLTLPSYAQSYSVLSNQIVDETMSFAEAQKALLVEVATINYNFYRDSDYKRERHKYASKSTFRHSGDNPFELNDEEFIRNYLENNTQKGEVNHTLSTGESRINFNFHTFARFIDKDESHTFNGLKRRTIPKKVYYADGSVESDEEVLKGKRWYSNRKFIDSVLVDVVFQYPTVVEKQQLPFAPSKKELGEGSFIWFVNYTEDEYDMIVTEDIYLNTLKMQCIGEDGQRMNISNSNAIDQPSTEMFGYLGEVYSLCNTLLSNMKDGKYATVKELVADYDRSKPTEPAIRRWYKSSYSYPEGTKYVEYSYITKRDSILVKDKMCYHFNPRESEYVVINVPADKRMNRGIVDTKGRLIISETKYTIDDFMGLMFLEINNNANIETRNIFLLNPSKKTLTLLGYKVKEVINKNTIIVKQNESLGMVDQNGKILIPIEFEEIEFNKKFGILVTKSKSEIPMYQVYDMNGKLKSKRKFGHLYFDDEYVVGYYDGKEEMLK